MSLSETSSSDFASCIELYSIDIKRYTNIYEKLDNDLDTWISNMKKDKLEFKLSFSDLDESLGLNIFTIDEVDVYLNHRSKLEKELSIDLTKFDIINECDNILVELGSLLQEISNNHQDILKTENPIKGNTKLKVANVSDLTLNSRQTGKEFIYAVMKPGQQYKCISCNEPITIYSPYLRHMEEYPTGSSVLKLHWYHAINSCLVDRGFQVTYLSDIKVKCEEEWNEWAMKCLSDVGFSGKNIQWQGGRGRTNQSDCGPRSINEFSSDRLIDQEPVNKVKPAWKFIYTRKTKQQSQKIVCVSCQTEIKPDSYLVRGNESGAPVHIAKKCVLGAVTSPPGNISKMKCLVYSLLRNNNELNQLLACGFLDNKIIGNRPQTTANKGEPVRPLTIEASLPVSKEVGFIFNEEPFHCARLVRAERCEGCGQYMTKGDLSLRHKERIPREKLVDLPLVSQWYHTSMMCLMKRGFTEKYLESALCHVTVSDQDNGRSVKDTVVRCGFSGENVKVTVVPEDSDQKNIIPIPPSPVTTVQVPVQISYLFIVTATKSSSSCSGCGFNIPVNDACFLYGVNAVRQENGGSILFHVKRTCLERHFTKAQMSTLTCINNNSIADVSDENIERCGIKNIFPKAPRSSLTASLLPSLSPYDYRNQSRVKEGQSNCLIC